MIEIKNVTKIYDGIRAVNQLNLTVRDGEIFVLLGSSGCGKSTTLNMINRLIEPTEGNIYIDGKDIKDFKPEILRRSIGYVVQGTGLFPNMTVGQNIGIVPKMSAYIGMPATVAKMTPKGLLSPSTLTINSSGIQL